MAVSTTFLDQITEIFGSLGAITARRMFGGATLFCDGVAFALIAGDDLYLRADDASKQRFIDEGLAQFTYEGKTGPVGLKYWRAPERLFDEPDDGLEWGRRAIKAAQNVTTQTTRTSKLTSRRPAPRLDKMEAVSEGVRDTPTGQTAAKTDDAALVRAKRETRSAKRPKI